MHARARLVIERGAGGRSLVRELRSQPPLCLLPRRGAVAAGESSVTVHMLSSASTPLGGDDVELHVVVGPGADAVLTGVAAALALPAQGGAARSRLVVRLAVGAGASLQYLPEATVVTRRAAHDSELHATLDTGARLRCREVLVAGRSGEPSGSYRGHVRVSDGDGPLLVQDQELGDPDLRASAAHLAGRRVLASELLVWGADPTDAVCGPWWALSPLARYGALATAVGADAVTAQRGLASAVAAHPGWAASVVGTTAGDVVSSRSPATPAN